MHGFTDEIKVCYGISGIVTRSTKVKYKIVLRCTFNSIFHKKIMEKNELDIDKNTI